MKTAALITHEPFIDLSSASRLVIGKFPVRRTFLWLNQVNEDHELPPNAFRVAYTISQLVNDKTNTAWPSQETLARKLNLSRRTVVSMIDALVTRGHLQVVTRSKGRGRSNHYRMFVKARMKPEQGG